MTLSFTCLWHAAFLFSSLKPLYVSEIKTWIIVNFLDFDENKTEVMLFGPSGGGGASYMDLMALNLMWSHM